MLPTRLMIILGALSLAVAAPASAQSVPGVAAAATRLGVDPQVIEDLVVANRILAHEGVLDAYGHVSIRHPTKPNHYLIARSDHMIMTQVDFIASLYEIEIGRGSFLSP